MIHLNEERLRSRIDAINQNIGKNIDKIIAPGLFHGKMGLAIYYYHQFRYFGEKEFENKANELIDQVWEFIGANTLTVDFENGLAGIGWGIEYLVQHGFVEADTDETLEDIDNKVFQHVMHATDVPIGIYNGLMGYATYLLWRLKGSRNLEVKSILERLLIEVINKIGNEIDKKDIVFKEPTQFNLLWNLPLLLFLFAEILELNIYNSKIHRILDELNHSVITLWPSLHSNRALLLLALNAVIKNGDSRQWESHITLLSNNIDVSSILNNEFPDRNISLISGLIGALFVLKNAAGAFPGLNAKFNPDLWLNKIVESSVWDDFYKIEKFVPGQLSVLNGITGLAILPLISDPKVVEIQ